MGRGERRPASEPRRISVPRPASGRGGEGSKGAFSDADARRWSQMGMWPGEARVEEREGMREGDRGEGVVNGER